MNSNMPRDSGETWRRMILVPCHAALIRRNEINLQLTAQEIELSRTVTNDEHKTSPVLSRHRKLS